MLVRHGETLVPSLAGLLTAGRYPQQFFPQLMVSLAVYPHRDPGRPGPGGLRFVDSATLGGPVPDMVAEAIQAVRRNIRVASRITGPGREDRWEVEPEVIREAIVNALMHRDYSPQARGTQVQIEVYPDRMTVTSPGGCSGTCGWRHLARAGRPRRVMRALRRYCRKPVIPSPGGPWRRTAAPAQLAALALAREGYDVDLPLLRRLGLNSGQSRRNSPNWSSLVCCARGRHGITGHTGWPRSCKIPARAPIR